MINLAVINLKDILNFFKKFLILLLAFLIIFKTINFVKNNNSINFEKMIGKNFLISQENDNENVKKESKIKDIFISELAIFNIEEEIMEKENQEEIIEFEKESEKEPENEIVNLQTQVISENNIKENYTDVYKSVKIKNESKYNLTQEILTPNVDFLNKNDIIIYHTHTCESYTPTEKDNYLFSGNYRTTDLNYSVARVGNELENYLLGYGYNVIHDKTYHDYPAYTGSYTRGLNTIKKILSEKKNAEFVIDLHRDALGSDSNYAPRVKIGDEVVSQIMFVIGTDGGGLEHPNWLNNFKLAIKIQEKGNEMYPGLFRPIILRDSRYNQHVAKGACIIEVGATGNTLEECNKSMKYLANVINEVVK